MKKQAALLALSLALSLIACSNNDTGKTTDNNQQTVTKTDDSISDNDGKSDHDAQSDHDGQSDSDGKSDDDDPTEDMGPKDGDECSMEGTLTCAGKNVLRCIENDFSKPPVWRKFETCSGNTSCVIIDDDYDCVELCAPAIDDITSVCEYDDDTNIYYSYTKMCTTKNGLSAWEVLALKACSSCSAQNQCIINEEDKGLNLEVGDSCNPHLFQSRCENGQAVNCIFDDPVGQYDNIGRVVLEQCTDGCNVVTGKDSGIVFSYCNEQCDKVIDNYVYVEYFIQNSEVCLHSFKDIHCLNGRAYDSSFYIDYIGTTNDKDCQSWSESCSKEQKEFEESLKEYEQDLMEACNESSNNYSLEKCAKITSDIAVDARSVCIDDLHINSLIISSGGEK